MRPVEMESVSIIRIVKGQGISDPSQRDIMRFSAKTSTIPECFMTWLETTFMVTGEIGVSQSALPREHRHLQVEVVSTFMGVVIPVRLVASKSAAEFLGIPRRTEFLNP